MYIYFVAAHSRSANSRELLSKSLLQEILFKVPSWINVKSCARKIQYAPKFVTPDGSAF